MDDTSDETSPAFIEAQTIFASFGVIRSIDDVSAKLGEPSETLMNSECDESGTRKAQYTFTAGMQHVDIIVIEYWDGHVEILSYPR